jgi:DNA-binding transcriptional LysR family regulator
MMNVTLSQVSAFERVVRLGSFHAAAQDLGLSQPAVSQRIRELEQALGVKLFVRNGRRVTVSADGTAMLAYADQLLKTSNEMVLRLRSHDPLKGVLRLGLSETFALVCLTSLLEQLETAYPSLKVSVHVGDTNALSGLLNEQKLDLAIISNPDVADHVRREPIGTNQHGWFAGASYDIGRKELTPQELCEHHLIITPPPARLYTTVTRWFTQSGVRPTRLSMCNSLAVTVLMTRSCIGISLTPRRVMQDSIANGEIMELVVEPEVPAHQTWICYQVEELGPGLQRVVTMIRQTANEKGLFLM